MNGKLICPLHKLVADTETLRIISDDQLPLFDSGIGGGRDTYVEITTLEINRETGEEFHVTTVYDRQIINGCSCLISYCFRRDN